MLCPPPITRETVGFVMPATSSESASPASTSPPTVFNMSSSPFISGFSSTATSSGIRCSYLVDLLSCGKTEWPSILPIILIYCSSLLKLFPLLIRPSSLMISAAPELSPELSPDLSPGFFPGFSPGFFSGFLAEVFSIFSLESRSPH